MLRRDEKRLPPPGWRGPLIPGLVTFVVVVGGAALTGIDIDLIIGCVLLLAATAFTIRQVQLRRRRPEPDRSADRRTMLIILGAFAITIVILLVYAMNA